MQVATLVGNMFKFVQIRRLSLIKHVPNYGKQKKYRGHNITYGELLKKQAAMNKVVPDQDTADTGEPLYPPIEDLSHEGCRRRKERMSSDEIKNLETVEEKIFKINMPRYYGWKSLILNEQTIAYDSLTCAQHVTRTHVVKKPGLPTYYDGIISNEQLDNITQEIKGSIEDNIVFEHCRKERCETEMRTPYKNYKDSVNKTKMNHASKSLIQGINRTMLVHLSSKYPHLLHTEVDYVPRLEASWFVGGQEPSAKDIAVRKMYRHTFVDGPKTFPVQYNGQPVTHLRHKHPLREFIPLSECENPDFDVPKFNFSAQVLGYKFERQHLTNIPGFWPGDESEFGFLSYLDCAHLRDRPKEYDDRSEALSVQAVLASYSWLLAQSCYQGFSTFNDITYPLTTQTVITDGQWWSFSAYQLNTTLLYSDYMDINPKRNVCWITEPMKLFDKIENEKIHGLNEEVLKTLIKFYVNTPEERRDVNLKPYLGESTKVIANIEHDERRNWLEKQYKHLMCNRPRHRRVPEIYDWQKFYLIKFKTRPMDKRREPWEFGINSFRRRLDDHTPRYIPKCLRENPKRKKFGRWANTYYP